MDSETPIIETQEEEVVTIQAVPKKPRSDAQLAALEAARKKAYTMRAEKAALRKTEEAEKAVAKVEAQKKPITLDTTQHPKEEKEEEEEEDIIYRKKPKKKKRVVVVQEESSSDSEIEVRIPKVKNQAIAKPKNPDQVRYEKAYNRLFSVDTL